MRACDRRDFLAVCATGAIATVLGRPSSASAQNEVVEQSRLLGLEVLKPNARDLAHGLELHASSTVFDVYGFSPNAAVDGERLAEAVKAGASDIELQDLEEDMRMTRYVTDAAERAEYLQAWEASGVTCVFQNAGEEGSSPLRLLKRLARFTYATDHLRDVVSKAVTPDDIVTAKQQGQRCLYFTGNGMPLTGDAVSVADELRYVRTFFELGVRMMHMTYNRRNLLGDGCAEAANGGLSDLGRAAVAEMNRVGVIVDVAHSGWRTSLEAAQVSQKPMVASHTSCAALQQHIRAKSDEVIQAIVEGGGLIGICAIPHFLGRTGDIAALLDHVDYVVKKFGIDHVGIGTDIGYRSRNDSAELKKVPARTKRRTRYEAFWPDDAFLPGADEAKRYPKSKSLAWTNWPLFTVGLVQRGYSDEQIEKILGLNMLRVARANHSRPVAPSL